jgi:hypothetical protein
MESIVISMTFALSVVDIAILTGYREFKSRRVTLLQYFTLEANIA